MRSMQPVPDASWWRSPASDSTGTVRWHDHRIHWMGDSRPPPVNADPRKAHHVGTWTVRATDGQRPFDITGQLSSIGKPDSANAQQPIPPWILTALESP
jgi:hypothetical protein